MKVDFTKFSKEPKEVTLEKNGVKFTILASKLSEKRIECKGKIQGTLKHPCDRCGEEFKLSLDEDIELIAYDGVAKTSDNELENIVEFFDGFVDFDEIFLSELEAIKSDYFYCKKCIN